MELFFFFCLIQVLPFSVEMLLLIMTALLTKNEIVPRKLSEPGGGLASDAHAPSCDRGVTADCDSLGG